MRNSEVQRLRYDLAQAHKRINQLERRTHAYGGVSRRIRRARENALLLYSVWLAGMPVSRGYMHDLMGMPERAWMDVHPESIGRRLARRPPLVQNVTVRFVVGCNEESQPCGWDSFGLVQQFATAKRTTPS